MPPARGRQRRMKMPPYGSQRRPRPTRLLTAAPVDYANCTRQLFHPQASTTCRSGTRSDYVRSLWDRIAAKPDRVPVPEWRRQVPDQRLAAREANPGVARPWEEVRDEIRSAVRSGHYWHRFRSSPSPSTLTTTSSPGCRKMGGLRAKPTPGGVPVETISPGSSVITWER